MSYALVVEVDNRGEDPDEGRRGLREELTPSVKQFPGFESALFMTAYERGRGIGVIVFTERVQAEQTAAVFDVGQKLRDGVTVTRVEVLEVSAAA
jgi:hypothetical protein